MRIAHKIDDFLSTLFPKYQKTNDLDVLKAEVADFYTYAGISPKVAIEQGWVLVDVDVPTILRSEKDFKQVIGFCENGGFKEAKKLLLPLIKQNPTNSEYHRILGQILSEEGDPQEAINSLIDALRWKPDNTFALTMLANVYAKEGDVDAAMIFYNQVLNLNPDDHLALNNIGANLLQLGKTKDAVEYLEKAYAINPSYPNTSYGLAMAYDILDYPLVAFGHAINCLKASGKPQDGMHKSALGLAVKLASELTKENAGMLAFESFRDELQKKTGIKIQVEPDNEIPTAAKIEYAENYNRSFHLIKYKPSYPAVEHLMMHELVHLEFSHQAREANSNMLFLSGKDMKTKFIRDNEKDLKRLEREGYSDKSISSFIVGLYEGINRQVFNSPIDLFIEDLLYENYQELRPYQFLSLTQLNNEGLQAVTNKQAVKLSPKWVLTASKVLNMVNAYQLKDLYGVDLLTEFNALPMENKEASRMWTEFLEYRKDRKAGEEYELVQHWGEDLRLDTYFQLVDEQDYRNKPKTVDEVIASMEDDPFGMEVDKNFKQKEMDTFLQNQQTIGLNMAVVMFMVDALGYFKGMPNQKIKAIAFEIAMIGTQGINSSGEHKYKVPSIAGKEFSGYHLLAYYYVSWKLAIPDMLAELKLPYDEEYKLAETMA